MDDEPVLVLGDHDYVFLGYQVVHVLEQAHLAPESQDSRLEIWIWVGLSPLFQILDVQSVCSAVLQDLSALFRLWAAFLLSR